MICSRDSRPRYGAFHHFRACAVAAGMASLFAITADTAVAQADTPTPKNANNFDNLVAPFLREYCIDCHGESEQEADRRFDQLAMPIDRVDDFYLLQDIYDQVSLGEMPPQEASQPSEPEKRRLRNWLRTTMDNYHRTRQSTGGETVLRRLNAREYRQTIGDLLAMDMTMFDPTTGFPRDEEVEHFDNVGDALVTSGYLLDRYLDAADQSIEKAILQAENFDSKTFEFHGPFVQQPEIDRARRRIDNLQFLRLLEAPLSEKSTGAYAALEAFRDGVPHDGWYEIRFQAEGINREHPYPRSLVSTNPSDPMFVGVVPGNATQGPLYHPQSMEPLLASVEISDSREWYTVRVWLDRGFTPRFTYINGPIDSRSVRNRLARQIVEERPELKGQEKGDVGTFVALNYGKLPQVHIHEVTIEGPLDDDFDQRVHESLFGSSAIEPDSVRAILKRFASRAYRRPATDDEVDRLLTVYQSRLTGGRELKFAIGDAMKAALCSPAFLYHAPLKWKGADEIDARALASRLSYFLWGAPPDDELLRCASDQSILSRDVRRQQAERLLADRRSNTFIASWLDNWLTLKQLGDQPPDRSAFQQYYAGNLKPAMLAETRFFVRELIDENRDVMQLINADYTYLNQPLAELYKIDDVKGLEMRRVRLDDPRRGGLLGHASLLTVTANGIDTSPVVRGVWVLENLLATPPAAPPNDVPPLDPDTRGATSIRDQLEKHRNNVACNDCHRKIDPIGFALENFDPIGRWRDEYKKSIPVDSRGRMPDGAEFDDVVDLKQILSSRRESFTRAVTEKLLVQALGRRVERLDRPRVDRLVDELIADNGGLRDLILLVATSDLFVSP